MDNYNMQQMNMNMQSGVNLAVSDDPTEEKKKISIVAVVLGALVVVFAGLALLFGLLFFTSNKEVENHSDEGVSSDETDEKEAEITVATMAEEYETVKNLMKELTVGIDNEWGDYIENSSGLTYKPKWSNTHFPLKLNLLKKIKNGNNGEGNVAILQEKLERAGFSAVGDLPVLGSAGPAVHGYYNQSRNVICGVYYEGVYQNTNNPNDGYEYGALECGLTDWIWLTKSERELAKELETAYHEKTNQYPVLMDGLGAKVKESQTPPYQTLEVSFGGAIGKFYRTSPDSKWQFFVATQASPTCEDYNTIDLKKAYVGDVCYINGTTESIVQLEG